MRLRISPARLRPTASGLMIARVRSIAKFSLLVIQWFLLFLRRFAEDGLHGVADFGGALHGMNACRLHRCIFRFRRSLAAADVCACVAHAASRGRGLSRHKTD